MAAVASQIAIYGAGGFAREVAWLVEVIKEDSNTCEAVCFIDDNPANHGRTLNGYPVLGLEAARSTYPQALVVGGIGTPESRQSVMEKAGAVGFSFATLVHPRVERSRWIEIGEGTVICAGNILTTNIRLGKHVQINLDCTIGHDVVMGDYTTLAPGVHVSGCVLFGKGVYVGTGAVILNGSLDSPIEIGDGAVIGGGAVVTRSINPGLKVVGIPAKPI